MISVTEQWAQYAARRARARARCWRSWSIRRSIFPTRRFPFLGAAELAICGGVPARLFRISFSGEMAYEMAVPARYGDATIRALMEAGADSASRPTAPRR